MLSSSDALGNSDTQTCLLCRPVRGAGYARSVSSPTRGSRRSAEAFLGLGVEGVLLTGAHVDRERVTDARRNAAVETHDVRRVARLVAGELAVHERVGAELLDQQHLDL